MEKQRSHIVRFTDVLVKNNSMQESEAQALIKDFSNKEFPTAVVSFLLEEGLIEREEILDALAAVYEVDSFDVSGHFFNHELLLLFPKDFLIKHLIIPLDVDDDILTIVMADPEDDKAIEEMGNFVNYNISLLVGIGSHIVDAVKEYYDENIIDTDIEEQDDEYCEEDCDEHDTESDSEDYY